MSFPIFVLEISTYLIFKCHRSSQLSMNFLLHLNFYSILSCHSEILLFSAVGWRIVINAQLVSVCRAMHAANVSIHPLVIAGWWVSPYLCLYTCLFILFSNIISSTIVGAVWPQQPLICFLWGALMVEGPYRYWLK